MRVHLQKITATGMPGAEWGALDAALALGIVAGGVCPAGFRTPLGPLPELLQGYGLEELDGDRDAALCENIWEADAVVRVTRNVICPEVANVEAICAGWAKPLVDIALDLWEGYPTAKPLEQLKLREFLQAWEVRTACFCGQIMTSPVSADKMAERVQALIIEALR